MTQIYRPIKNLRDFMRLIIITSSFGVICICSSKLHLSLRSILAAGALSSYMKARLDLELDHVISDLIVLIEITRCSYTIPLNDGTWDKRELVTVLGSHVPGVEIYHLST